MMVHMVMLEAGKGQRGGMPLTRVSKGLVAANMAANTVAESESILSRTIPTIALCLEKMSNIKQSQEPPERPPSHIV